MEILTSLIWTMTSGTLAQRLETNSLRSCCVTLPQHLVKSAGTTPEERDSFSKILEEGYVDCFRHLHGEVFSRHRFFLLTSCRMPRDGSATGACELGIAHGTEVFDSITSSHPSPSALRTLCPG